MAETFSIKFDSSGLNAALDDLATQVQHSVRPAAQAGAQVLYDEARLRAPERSGLLKSSIYQTYSKDNSGADHATYHVSWNHTVAPHGHLLEFGTSRAPAHPFIRPAFEARKQDALTASKTKFEELMQQAIGGHQA